MNEALASLLLDQARASGSAENVNRLQQHMSGMREFRDDPQMAQPQTQAGVNDYIQMMMEAEGGPVNSGTNEQNVGGGSAPVSQGQGGMAPTTVTPEAKPQEANAGDVDTSWLWELLGIGTAGAVVGKGAHSYANRRANAASQTAGGTESYADASPEEQAQRSAPKSRAEKRQDIATRQTTQPTVIDGQYTEVDNPRQLEGPSVQERLAAQPQQPRLVDDSIESVIEMTDETSGPTMQSGDGSQEGIRNQLMSSIANNEQPQQAVRKLNQMGLDIDVNTYLRFIEEVEMSGAMKSLGNALR